MARYHDTVRFTPEMGRRLREIRQSLGFKQSEVARIMGRESRSAGNIVSRLEAGKVPYPSLGLIADFLRACDSSFRAISDILSAYMKMNPAKVHKAEVDERIHTRPPRPETGTKARASRHARLEQHLFDSLIARGSPPALEERQALARYGRSVFLAMERERLRERTGVKRASARVRLDPARMRAMRQSMETLFEEMDRSGQLYWTGAVGRKPKPVARAERRLKTDFENKLAWRRASRYYLIERLKSELQPRVMALPNLEHQVSYYLTAVSDFWDIAEATEGDPAERRRRFEARIAQAHDKPTVRLIGEHVLERYPELSKSLTHPPEKWISPCDDRPKGF